MKDKDIFVLLGEYHMLLGVPTRDEDRSANMRSIQFSGIVRFSTRKAKCTLSVYGTLQNDMVGFWLDHM